MFSPAEPFETLVSTLDYPMFIVTAATHEQRAGCLVGFVTQASISPPRLVVMLSKANHTFHVAHQTDYLAVHFLHPGNRELATLFGEESGDRVDKFESCDWVEGPHNLPLLDNTRGWIVGHVIARVDSGDHVAHLLETIDAATTNATGAQLGFQAIRDMTPGHPA